MKYKAELTQKENGEWRIISYSNRLIPYSILSELNNAVHDVIDRVNGKLDWRQTFIRFRYDGKTYYQEPARLNSCDGCCFRTREKCTHPYFETKGNCTGKIYKEETK